MVINRLYLHFDARAVRPGTHLNCIGANVRGKRELPEGLLQKARVVVDDRQQERHLGELQWAPQTSCMELGDLLAGSVSITRAAPDITVCDMTGLALQDLAVARLIFHQASTTGAGARMAWVTCHPPD